MVDLVYGAFGEGILLVIHGQKCSWVDPLSQFFKEHTGDNSTFFKIRKIVLFYMCFWYWGQPGTDEIVSSANQEGLLFSRGGGHLFSNLLRTQQNLSLEFQFKLRNQKQDKGIPRRLPGLLSPPPLQ